MRWVISALIAALGLFTFMPGVAFAHEATLTGSATCKAADGSWSINWTLSITNSDGAVVTHFGDPDTGAPAFIEIVDGIAGNDLVADDFDDIPINGDGSASATTDYGPTDNPTGPIFAHGTVRWGNEVPDFIYGFNSNSISIPDLCEEPPDCDDPEYAAQNPEECNPPCEGEEVCEVLVCVDGEILPFPEDQEPPSTDDCDVITICSDGELVTGTEFDLADLPRTDDCDEEVCAFDPDLDADDPDCAPPPAIAQGCVDTDGDGQGDEIQLFPEGNPPAGAIMSADGDACTPVTLPQPPVQEVQAVTTISEVLPVALPASGQGFGSDNGIAQSTWIAALAAALVATGSLSLLTARRRTADVVVAPAAPARTARTTALNESGSGWLLAVAAGIIGLAALRTRGRNKRR
jgi:hypothetical protein